MAYNVRNRRELKRWSGSAWITKIPGRLSSHLECSERGEFMLGMLSHNEKTLTAYV